MAIEMHAQNTQNLRRTLQFPDVHEYIHNGAPSCPLAICNDLVKNLSSETSFVTGPNLNHISPCLPAGEIQVCCSDATYQQAFRKVLPF